MRKDRDGKDYQHVSPFWGPGGCFYANECSGPGDGEKGCPGARCQRCLGTGRGMQWYQNRNYDAFAILTGTVRNGAGFAGVRTGGGFRGIVPEPRGLPDDVSRAVMLGYHGDHSEGWLGLREILDFDWDQITSHCGVIPMRKCDALQDPFGEKESYEEWRKQKPLKAPKSYSGDVSGQNIHVISWQQAERILNAPEKRREVEVNKSELDLEAFAHRGAWQHVVTSIKPTYDQTDSITRWYVRCEWTETYRESASDFLEFVEKFLVPLGDPADTRIVFGFDS